jgi:hypothetical protein
MKITNLINSLDDMIKNDKYLHDMYFRFEPKCVVICLEETIFDYDFRNDDLMSLLSNYNYEWYNSTEIEVYLA